MVYIIVEGITDKALVKNILSDKIENTHYKFLGLKGDGNVTTILNNLTQKDLSENIYFAIVDADESFEERNREMTVCTNGNVGFYIFPNHQDNGNLETLLLSHIDEDNKIIKCFDKYKTCVDETVEKEIDNKAKLYAYTTLKHNQRPEKYIKDLTIGTEFDDLKQKLQTLFEGTN